MNPSQSKVIYIAGKYRDGTINGVWENIQTARTAARKYWLMGYAVICPHLNTMLMDGEDTDNLFLEGDAELLRRSDAIVMLSGWEESAGAKSEHELATKQGKEIIYEG
jgi:hypothetical protein